MNLSYWEYKTWLYNIDFTIFDSGIVGVNGALQLRKRHTKAKNLVLEKGLLLKGTSTKNIGFVCFGNIFEILHPLLIGTMSIEKSKCYFVFLIVIV